VDDVGSQRRRDIQPEQPPRMRGNRRPAPCRIEHHYRARVDQAINGQRDHRGRTPFTVAALLDEPQATAPSSTSRTTSKYALVMNAGSEQPAEADGLELVYEPNPKHKEPWQRGARGSLCPKGVDSVALLAASVADPLHPGKRYATDGERAYCGQEHLTGRWHGYPVQWKEVPAAIRRILVDKYQVSRRDLREYW